ncbi:MAG TPA: pyridoxamine 5'-phosphate oxidase family protein [Chloroflexaceae bacterium]|nr:pyridoxamine 5'-phosphate oxidase family protein [Chloroflexaceae bacterium]
MAEQQTPEIKKVAELMRALDFCMFTTVTADGGMYARPMSNNREVEFDGDIWFFSGADTRKVDEISREPRVHLSYADPQRFCFISVEGVTEVVTDVDKKRELWLKELERWFPNGPEDENVVLLKVRPSVIAYWTGDGDGQVTME